MNPFESLKRPRPQDITWDEWGGAFSCQERGCYLVVGTAKYISRERVLTWKCPDGHISSIEDVDE